MLADGIIPIKYADNSHPAAFSPSSLSLSCSPSPHKEGESYAVGELLTLQQFKQVPARPRVGWDWEKRTNGVLVTCPS